MLAPPWSPSDLAVLFLRGGDAGVFWALGVTLTGAQQSPFFSVMFFVIVVAAARVTAVGGGGSGGSPG